MDATPDPAVGCGDHLPVYCAVRSGPWLAWRARVVPGVFHRDAQAFWGQTGACAVGAGGCRGRHSRAPYVLGQGGGLNLDWQLRVASSGDADSLSGQSRADPSPGSHPETESVCCGLAAAGPGAPTPVTPHPGRFARVAGSGGISDGRDGMGTSCRGPAHAAVAGGALSQPAHPPEPQMQDHLRGHCPGCRGGCPPSLLRCGSGA